MIACKALILTIENNFWQLYNNYDQWNILFNYTVCLKNVIQLNKYLCHNHTMHFNTTPSSDSSAL